MRCNTARCAKIRETQNLPPDAIYAFIGTLRVSVRAALPQASFAGFDTRLYILDWDYEKSKTYAVLIWDVGSAVL